MFFFFLQYHLGTLKAKLARLRNELFVEQSGGGGGGSAEGFSVARNGDARIALIGFPSVGKSSLLSTLTSTDSEAAGYGKDSEKTTAKRRQRRTSLNAFLFCRFSHALCRNSVSFCYVRIYNLDVYSWCPQIQGIQGTGT